MNSRKKRQRKGQKVIPRGRLLSEGVQGKLVVTGKAAQDVHGVK